jgi:hypothetical protein
MAAVFRICFPCSFVDRSTPVSGRRRASLWDCHRRGKERQKYPRRSRSEASARFSASHTMYPLIRPGSIVQIDGNQRKVLPVHWDNEHERPIFFIELRDEYICSWCEIREGHLLAVPYPNSRCEIRRFPYPREAEIVGRVTGVTMRLAESQA